MTLENVMSAMGQGGNEYLIPQIQPYYDEVISFLKDSGVPMDKITVGVVAVGVADLWNYGAGNGRLSPYFLQRAAQLYRVGGA